MPLPFASPGQPQTIRRISGTPEMRKHLEALGFTVGGTVTIINSLRGNLIVQVKESRIAMDRDLANHVAI
jgi:ferrous iron transport protein A